MVAKILVTMTAIFFSVTLAAADKQFHQDMFFEKGKPENDAAAKVTEQQAITLKDHLNWLTKYKGTSLTIISYTDGDECTNDCEALRKSRAKLAYDWFISHGIDPTRLDMYTLGDGQPIDVKLKSMSQHDFNRRVEFFGHD